MINFVESNIQPLVRGGEQNREEGEMAQKKVGRTEK